METIEVCDGWTVAFEAPVLRIMEGDAIAFESDEWNPNMADPREDALSWASAVASPDSGLTVEDDDDPDYARGVRYVRNHAPAHFADECALLAEERRGELFLREHIQVIPVGFPPKS